MRELQIDLISESGAPFHFNHCIEVSPTSCTGPKHHPQTLLVAEYSKDCYPEPTASEYIKLALYFHMEAKVNQPISVCFRDILSVCVNL